MTDKIKAIEKKFAEGLPVIVQGELGKTQPKKFDKHRFIKSALALQKVIKENDKRSALL
jgi:hypothetical protein